jgi:signal transduction histidine kinase
MLASQGVCLAVLTLFLGYLHAYDARLRVPLNAVAARASGSPTDVAARLGPLLGHVAGLLLAPKVVLAWTGADQAQGTIAEWTQGSFRLRAVPREALGDLAPPALARASFLVRAARRVRAGFHVVSLSTSERRREDPLPAWVRDPGEMRAALSIPLAGASFTGRLFVLDPADATADELALGDLLAREIVTHMDQLALFDRFHRSGVAEERMRFARDLHDGVIQSLAAAAMRLEAARHVLRRDVDGADKAIQEIQDLLTGEQQELRDIIATLQPDRRPRYDTGSTLRERLESMVAGLSRHWRLTIETDNRVPDTALSPTLVREVTWIVREALVNAVRHGRARHASVYLALVDGLLHLRVADDGCGFRFRGRVEAAKTTEPGQTPFNLGQRVRALGGKLVIDSSDAGATLEMSIPLRTPRNPT